MESSPTTAEEVPAPLPPRLLRVAVAFISIMGALSILGTALSPYLAVRHPLGLLALNADARHLVLVAAGVDPVVALPIAVVRRTLGMFSTYAFGAIWGFAVVRWAGRRWRWLGQMMDWLTRIFTRLGLMVLVIIPSYTLCLLAGSSRMPWRRVLAAISVGQVITSVALLWFGDLISGWTQVIIRFFEDHLVASTAVAVVLVVAQQIVQRRGGRRSPPEGAA